MVTPEALQFAQALRARQNAPNKASPMGVPRRPMPTPGMAAPRAMAPPPTGYTPVAPPMQSNPMGYSPRPAQMQPVQRRNALGVQRLM